MKYKKITDIDQYNLYCEMHEKLTLQDFESHREEIELIEILIDEYESREMEYKKEMNPVELLEYLLKEGNISNSQLSRELTVSRQLVSDILMYRRNISKSMIMKLAKRFKMQPLAFSRDYKLKNLRKKEQVIPT